MRRLALAVGIAVGIGGAAPAEIYRWVDAQGRVHFTEDLSRVPPEQRAGVSRWRGEGSDRIQTYTPSSMPERAPSAPKSPQQAPSPGATTHRFRVQRAGTALFVTGRVNDQTSVPFHIDTGATDVVIPEWAARELGIQIGPDTLHKRYGTANGVIEQPVVLLDAIEVAGARVENVTAAVSDSMRSGLLGLSFFNRFTYHIDAAAGVVTLTPNPQGAAGNFRAGLSEAQWRERFARVRFRISRVEEAFAGLGPLEARHDRAYRRALDSLERELALLDEEADRGRVPQAWRY